MPKYCFLFVVLVLLTGPAQCATAQFIPTHLPPVKKGAQETLAVILRTGTAASDTARPVVVRLKVPEGISVTPESQEVKLPAGRNVPMFFKLTFTSDNLEGNTISAIIDSKPAGTAVIGGVYDLEAVKWKAKLDKENAAVKEGWAKPDFDDSSWPIRTLPSMWNDTGITYLRTKLFIPESWKGKEAVIKIKAIDDCDICYLNGTEIGKTDGWDVERNYKAPSEVIRYGEDNLLCIAVNNISAGGGIYRSPNYFGVDIPKEAAKPKVKLAPADKIGKPMPFRKMIAKNGVLLYEDGGEVALWGANYYPQSWYQFDNMKRLGVDMKKAVRDDLDDMKRMGVEVIRIHVFDREISDGVGNLIDNEHLDLLDYLISEGTKRGIYFMFTPIAWWWGPNQNPDSFSAKIPKEFMFCDDEAIKAQANYTKNWLNHKNRYTGKQYKDEPAICAFEIINEPAYATYAQMYDPDLWYYQADANKLAPVKERLRKKWEAWCASHGVDTEPRFFKLFRYDLMSDYLRTMHAAFRSTGATQPVASGLFDTSGQDDLTMAIADSPCEAVTTGAYAGAWDKVGDNVDYLPYAKNEHLDPRLNKKVRFVYEFDGIKTYGSYFYPAMARRFRHQGVQICSMFQYDSGTTAEWNTDWDAHYLNWFYTPGKAVSFYIGGQVFQDLPRGASFPDTGTTQQFGNCAVSFDRNISIYTNGSIYCNTSPVKDWKPLTAPENPQTIVSVGDSPYASYDGTGIYALNVDYSKKEAVLTVNPDADIVGDPWHPNANKSAVVLKNREHRFELKLSGIKLTEVTDSKNNRVDVKSNAFQITPGQYLLKW